MPTTGEIVLTTGLCSMYDFKLRDEVVARYPARSMPGGWAYIELRHLTADELSSLAPLRTPADLAACPTERSGCRLLFHGSRSATMPSRRHRRSAQRRQSRGGAV